MTIKLSKWGDIIKIEITPCCGESAEDICEILSIDNLCIDNLCRVKFCPYCGESVKKINLLKEEK